MPRSESLTGSESGGAEATDRRPCGLCGELISINEEEYISGTCSMCGEAAYHTDCVIELLQEMAKRENSTKWVQARKAYALKRPAHQFELQTPRCPVGSYKEPAQRPSCPGRITAAQPVKPQRAPGAPSVAPAPATHKAPAPAGTNLPRGTKPRALHAHGGIIQRSYSSSSGKGHVQQQQQQQQQPFEIPTRDRLGVRLPGFASQDKSERRGGKSSLHFGPGGRPDRLKLCSNWRDCRALNCVFAHDKMEQAAREAEWVEEEEKRIQHEQRKREMEEAQQRAALRARAEEAREAATNLSVLAIASMQEYKVFYCSGSLMEMGFDPACAEQASQATGGEVEAAVNLLAAGALEGAPPQPVDVSREAEQLVGVALLLGLSVATVESQLLACRGNWEAAEEVLKEHAQQAQHAQQAAGSGGAFPEHSAWAEPTAGSADFPCAGGGMQAPPLAAAAALDWGYVGEASMGTGGSEWEPVYYDDDHESQQAFWPAAPEAASAGTSISGSEAAATTFSPPAPEPSTASVGTFSAGYEAGMAAARAVQQAEQGPAGEAAGGAVGSVASIDWSTLLGPASTAAGPAASEDTAVDSASGWGDASKGFDGGLSGSGVTQGEVSPDPELSDMLALLGVG